MESELCGLPHKVNGTLRIGQPGKLDLDAEIGLLANVRLRNPELIDSVADSAHGLIKGHVLNLFSGGIRKDGKVTQSGRLPRPADGHGHRGRDSEPRKIFRQQRLKIGLLRGAREQKFQTIVGSKARPQHGNPFLRSARPDFLPGDGKGVGHGLFHLHTERQVHPSFQIKTKADLRIGQKRASGEDSTPGRLGSTYATPATSTNSETTMRQVRAFIKMHSLSESASPCALNATPTCMARTGHSRSLHARSSGCEENGLQQRKRAQPSYLSSLPFLDSRATFDSVSPTT